MSQRFHPKEVVMTVKNHACCSIPIPESSRQEFLAKLQDVFSHIVNEATFVGASLVHDMRNPESILSYEVWNETPESFMKDRMNKAYRANLRR
jgi:quinol monooxygenase YgiN